MASTDNGGQVITFRYQQEGTAKGFNKLLTGVIPCGVISGGEFLIESDAKILISPLEMMIGDDSVTVHVETTSNAEVTVSASKPYVVAYFNWTELAENYVTFSAMSYDEITNTNYIILGKCEYIGTTLKRFDYTKKRWSFMKYNNAFLKSSGNAILPNLSVSYYETSSNTLGFTLTQGEAVIDGKYVSVNQKNIELTTENTTSILYINPSLSYARIDVAYLTANGTVGYVCGVDSSNPTQPDIPINTLMLARFNYTTEINGSTINKIYGSNITSVYTQNYIGEKKVNIESTEVIIPIDENTNTTETHYMLVI